MSGYVHKTALRLPIPRLTGRSFSDVLAYFTEYLGPPEEVDEDDEHFWYPSWYESNVLRGSMSFIHPITDHKGHWAFEILLALHCIDWNYSTGLCPDVLQGKPIDPRPAMRLAEDLRMMGYEELAPFELVSYTWHNGGDEPVHFDLAAWENP